MRHPLHHLRVTDMDGTNETSEGSYIGWLGHGEDDDLTPEEELEAWRISAKALYEKAKAAPVGSNVSCPTCSSSHRKNTYHHVFCKPTQRGQSSCKDVYWNAITDVRFFRTQLMSGRLR